MAVAAADVRVSALVLALVVLARRGHDVELHSHPGPAVGELDRKPASVQGGVVVTAAVPDPTRCDHSFSQVPSCSPDMILTSDCCQSCDCGQVSEHVAKCSVVIDLSAPTNRGEQRD